MVEKPVWNNARRVNHQNSQRLFHPHSKRSFVSKAVLTNSRLKTLNTARQTSSRAAVSVNTARPINVAYPRSTVIGARPSSNVFNKAHSHGNPQQELQEKGVIDSGCSRHMTGNMSYFLRRERALRNEFESMIRQDKDANGNRIFTPVNTAGSIYVYFGGSIPINVATLPNADLPTDPLMLDLEDTTDT
nr:hypothetical protein [Tanacetum cinerariifolium]